MFPPPPPPSLSLPSGRGGDPRKRSRLWRREETLDQ